MAARRTSVRRRRARRQQRDAAVAGQLVTAAARTPPEPPPRLGVRPRAAFARSTWRGPQRRPGPAHALLERQRRRARRRGAGRRAVRSSKSSSSAGISTKRRLSSCSCGSVMRSCVSSSSPSSRMSMSIARGPWRTPAAPRPELALEALDRVEQLERLERGLHAHARVQEARLVEHLADRVGVVGRGAREHRHAGAGQRVDGAPAGARGARRRCEPSPSSPTRCRVGAHRADATGRGDRQRRGSSAGRAGQRPSRPSPARTGTRPESGRSITVKSAISPSLVEAQQVDALDLPARDARAEDQRVRRRRPRARRCSGSPRTSARRAPAAA